MHPPSPKSENRPAGHGTADRRRNFKEPEQPSETAREYQAFRLVSKFGFAFETAVVVAALAWGIAR